MRKGMWGWRRGGDCEESEAEREMKTGTVRKGMWRG